MHLDLTYLVLAGMLKALRDASDWPGMQWLWRFNWLVDWRETHAKILFWPLDMWHICDVLLMVVFARTFLGWFEALGAVTVTLASFQLTTFLLHDRPVEALSTWWRKLRTPKEDHTIP